MDWTFSLLSQNSADLVMVSSQTEYISCYCYPWSFNAWRKDFRHCHRRNRNKIDPSQMKIEKPILQEARRNIPVPAPLILVAEGHFLGEY